MKRIFIGVGLLLAFSSCIKKDNRPNIILFLVDDMGWQDTSVPFWEEKTELNEKYHTPNMERLAAQGMKFSNAYASSISSPTRVSLLTGANVAQHKVSNWTLNYNQSTDRHSDILDFGDWNKNGLSPEAGIENTFYAKALPQVLRENGYTTMMVGKAHFGAIGTPAEDPLVIGFDYNIAGHAAGAMGSYLGEQNYGMSNDPNKKNVWGVPHLEEYHGTETFLTEALTLEAKKLMNTALEKENPFFLYMSHYAVHAPFGTDKRYYQKYIDIGLSHKEAQYAALVEGMDKSLGDIMDYLEEKEIAKNTIVIFMSDNGGYSIGRGNSNAPARGGKGSLFEGGIREPMIVSWQGVTEPASVCRINVHADDFFPSILEMAEAKEQELPQNLDGQSFVPLLKNEKNPSRAMYFHYPNNWGERTADCGYPQSAIIVGDWKFVYDYETQQKHLYNVKEDIGEKNNLAGNLDYQPTLDELSGKLSSYLKNNESNMPISRETGEYVNYPDGTKCELAL